jgi:superfamily II RNA helicase
LCSQVNSQPSSPLLVCCPKGSGRTVVLDRFAGFRLIARMQKI